MLKKESYANGGINDIKEDELRNMVINMFNDLKKSKIIILEYGCLESTLDDLGIKYTKNRNKWFEKAMGLVYESSNDIIESSNIYKWIFK